MAPPVAEGALPAWVAVLGCGLTLCCLGGAGPLWSSHEWRKLILTQHWPPTVCKEVDSCRDTLDYWTIHGLWKHEWEKHGTCAAQVDALNSEKKYFGKSLDLYKQLDLNSVLLKFGIKPSINYYQLADFKDALTRIYGVVPKIQCLLPEQGEDVQTIGQIELCFTKEGFHLRNCTEPGEQLPYKQEAWLAEGASTEGLMVCEDGPLFYPPPTKTQR
ncbi:ribonuclease T2 isoform X4 [Nannospalax galili]|uniref:ribonuclease T2 isoform X4 n=1 Tax=Nannospalax galili TaxID=1026970 RepID=UPI00111C2607|nr:ribonuclease T2 isoform X4 [Nannospalax galili]